MALLAGLAISCHALAKQDTVQTAAQAVSGAQPSLASKLLGQSKPRTSRSLSDMFEKMKSKIFGSRKQSQQQQQQASQSQNIQSVAPLNSANAQRQPWADVSIT